MEEPESLSMYSVAQYRLSDLSTREDYQKIARGGWVDKWVSVEAVFEWCCCNSFFSERQRENRDVAVKKEGGSKSLILQAGCQTWAQAGQWWADRRCNLEMERSVAISWWGPIRTEEAEERKDMITTAVYRSVCDTGLTGIIPDDGMFCTFKSVFFQSQAGESGSASFFSKTDESCLISATWLWHFFFII